MCSSLIPNGENFLQLQNRVYDCFENIINNHQKSKILIVAHGGTIASILAKFLKMDLSALWNIRQENTAVNIINVHSKHKIVYLVNDTSYLMA